MEEVYLAAQEGPDSFIQYIGGGVWVCEKYRAEVFVC